MKQQGVITFEFVVVTQADEKVFAAWRDDGLTYAPHKAEAIAALSPGEGEGDGAQSKTAAASIAPSNIVRVDLTRLDGLMKMIGELVISRSRLKRTWQVWKRRTGDRMARAARDQPRARTPDTRFARRRDACADGAAEKSSSA